MDYSIENLLKIHIGLQKSNRCIGYDILRVRLREKIGGLSYIRCPLFFLVSLIEHMLNTVKRSLSSLVVVIVVVFFFSSQNNFDFKQLPSSFVDSKPPSLAQQRNDERKEMGGGIEEKANEGERERKRTNIFSLRRVLSGHV